MRPAPRKGQRRGCTERVVLGAAALGAVEAPVLAATPRPACCAPARAACAWVCDTPACASSPGAVYDITNTPNAHANEAIKTLNRFTRDTFGLGGIFHGAVEVNGEEWSFGAGVPLQRRRPGTALARPGVAPFVAPHRPASPCHPWALSHPTRLARQATARTGQGCVSPSVSLWLKGCVQQED